VVTEDTPPALSRQNSLRRQVKRKNTDDSGSTKKRLKRVVQSDVEEEEYMDPMDDEPDVQDDEEDEAFVFDEKPAKRSTTKRRGKTDEADEYITVPSEPARRKAKAPKHDDSFVVADDEEEASQDLNSKQKSPAPPLKRPKLPTIKKNKPSGVSTPIAKAPSLVVPPVPPKQDTVRKTWMEAADLDLSDKSIYEELFKGVCVATFSSTSSHHTYYRLAAGHLVLLFDGPKKKNGEKSSTNCEMNTRRNGQKMLWVSSRVRGCCIDDLLGKLLRSSVTDGPGLPF